MPPPRQRSSNLSRERDANRAGRPPLRKGDARETVIPEIPEEWPDICKKFWEAILTSGQEDYYQNSDYMVAYVLLDELAAYRQKQPMRVKDSSGRYQDVIDPETGEIKYYPTHKLSGQMFQTIISGFVGLGLTEGDRRKMSIELEKPVQDDTTPAKLAIISDYRDRLKKPTKAA